MTKCQIQTRIKCSLYIFGHREVACLMAIVFVSLFFPSVWNNNSKKTFLSLDTNSIKCLSDSMQVLKCAIKVFIANYHATGALSEMAIALYEHEST